MSSWTNKFGPGFMIIPLEPHPQGSKYQSIADGDKSGSKLIMWRVKLIKGKKDWPKRGDGLYTFTSKYEQQGYTTTTVLFLEMTKPINGTGRVVTGNSGFCATQSILALPSHGVYAQFLIKKRKYWPKGVPGVYIDKYMSNKLFGATESFVQDLCGTQFMSIVQKIVIM